MTCSPQPLPPVPEATAAAVRAAFPKGNLYVDLRTEFGTLYEDGFPGEIEKFWALGNLSIVTQTLVGTRGKRTIDEGLEKMPSATPKRR